MKQNNNIPMDFNNITFDLPKNRSAAIKVIGVGGGGSNAVNYMFQQGITGVDFVVSNTDAQALNNSPVPNKVQLGASITEGLGAGANPEIGEKAALESMDDIKALLDNNTKMLFITAGMGGGTGTGAAPIIASIAKEMGILTVGICTAPFSFEGKMRMAQANAGIEKFRNNLDSLIIINNDKLRELYGNLGYKAGFAKADEVLATAAKGIAEVITHHYSTNIDLRDARTVLADSGTAIMGSATAEGEGKAQKAIEKALDSPLLNDNKITGAKNVLLLIVSGEDEATMDEIGIINDYIQNEAGYDANIIMGIGEDPSLGEKICVTVIATGFPQGQSGLNGKEEKTIIHKLEDENSQQIKEEPQSINKNVVTHKLEDDFEDEELISSQNAEVEIADADLDFKLYNVNEVKSDEVKPNAVKNQQAENTINSEKDVDSTPENSIKHYTLDDNWDDESETPIAMNKAKIEAPKSIAIAEEDKNQEYQNNQEKKVIDEDPFNNTISDAVNQQIEDRRERLKKFNFKFKSALKDVDEIEKIPAYKRHNITLSEHTQKGPGNYIVDRDNNDEIKIRPNNFLHDNVD